MISKNKKKIFFSLLTLFSGVGLFILAAPVQAGWATDVIGGLLAVIIGALGLILALVMQVLVAVAQYHDFIGSPAVEYGWVIVRDVCNMFFVLILLIIAFATILKIENYSYKKWLPKLILMAILINFSKTICGLMIDFAQVVMLTFVNAFKDIAAGNLVTNLGITEILTLAKDTETVSFWAIIGAYVLGLIYILVALVVIVTMLAMLMMRIVMIWIYVVLSPAAYLMSAFPGGQKFASQWWSEFSKNLIVGPVLAFFIWLSFVSLQAPTLKDQFPVGGPSDTKGVAGEVGIPLGETGFAATQASTPDVFIKFIIAIGMLVGGLKISQEIGGAAGGIAGKGMAKISSGAAFAGGLATGAVAFGGKKIGQGARGLGMMAANSSASKKMLGNVAASSSKWARFTGARALATRGLITVNKHQKEIEEKAQKKIDNIKNSQVVARYAREKAYTPIGKASQKKAANMMPSALGSAAKVSEKLAGMSREDLNKLSDPEWRAIGKTGAKLEGRAKSYIEKNSDERGAFNRGMDQSRGGTGMGHGHPDQVSGTDKNGNAIRGNDRWGSYMNPTRTPLHVKEAERLDRDGDSSTFYFKEEPKIKPNSTTKVESEETDQLRGNGNLSVNEFARGKSDTVAVDFDKLNVKAIDKGTDSDNRNIRGVNTSNPAAIKEISSKMVSAIDQEINKIKGKGANVTAGDNIRMDNLETAKNKFSKPENIDNLSLVNSSAASYKMSDVKTSKIHEEVHGLGVKDEDDARYVTQKVIDGQQYGTKGANAGRTDKETVGKILAEKPVGQTESVSSNQKPIDDVLKEEKNASSNSEEVTLNTASLDKSMESFTKKLDDVSKKFNFKPVSAGQQAPVQPNFVYLFNSLKKAVTSSNQSVANKISSLGGDKAESPLEIKAISEQVSTDVNNI